MTGIRSYRRKRYLPYEVRFIPGTSAVQDISTGEIHYRVGRIHKPGRIDIFLGSTVKSLENNALRLGKELKEAHIRDDLIETTIHESTHRLIDRIHGGQLPWSLEGNEKVVDRITQEVMERIREEPRLAAPDISSKVKAKQVRGMLREID